MDGHITTPEQVKLLNKAREKRIKGLNHDQTQSIKLSLYEDLIVSTPIRRKYRLRPETWETLKIVWLNPGVSAYRINLKQLNTHTATQARLTILLQKGLIDRFSAGHQECYMYVISDLFLSELSAVLSSQSVA